MSDNQVNKEMKFIIDSSHTGERIDKYLSAHTELSRTHIQNLIEVGRVTVNGEAIPANYKIKEKDRIVLVPFEPVPLEVKPQDMNIEIVYQDNDVAIINKPKNMSVHPTEFNTTDTLVNGLLYSLTDLSGINGVLRPGIVHRIDKDTTGLLMVAKNDYAHEFLANQLMEHTVNRTYQALVYGRIEHELGKIDAPIGRDPHDRKKMAVVENGKPAITNFKVLERFDKFTFIECKLETGRTHQIRVHMAYIGHPVVGDTAYGPRTVIGNQGQFLHAKTIGFVHPTTKEYMEFNSELPQYMVDFMNELRKNDRFNSDGSLKRNS